MFYGGKCALNGLREDCLIVQKSVEESEDVLCLFLRVDELEINESSRGFMDMTGICVTMSFI